MDPEGIVLSEMSNTVSSHLYVEFKKQNKQSKMKTDSQIQRANWLVVARGEEAEGFGKIGEEN